MRSLPAPESPTAVTVGESHFDVGGIGDWAAANIWVFLLIAAVLFVFFLFQKGGFAEKFLEYRIKRDELESKRLDDMRVITDIFAKKYDRPDPLLPFDDNDLGRGR